MRTALPGAARPAPPAQIAELAAELADVVRRRTPGHETSHRPVTRALAAVGNLLGMSARAHGPTRRRAAVGAAAPARRRRRVARIDVALGTSAAALALLIGPGLGVIAVGALALVAVCALPPALRLTRAWGGRAVSRWR
jgi:hypothetical protein